MLAKREFNPPSLVFPVSAVMLEKIKASKRVLADYSRRLLRVIDWRATEGGSVEVIDDTVDYYRFFDATPHAEFLYHWVRRTIERDLPEEARSLRDYNAFRRGIETIVDMPARTVDLLFRFLTQNGECLSKRAREKEFRQLTDEEIVSSGGNNAWRISDAQGSGGFSGKPWSPSVVPVGEPGSHLWNDRGPDHTSPLDPPNENGSPAASQFSFSFDFRSETGTTQDGMFMSISPGPRQSSFRQSYIGLDADDDTPGIDVNFFETTAGGSFNGRNVATSLDASETHTIRMDIQFRDGLAPNGDGNAILSRGERLKDQVAGRGSSKPSRSGPLG